jgi:quercetin dioxygenase-like cupin family protein
MRPNRWWAVLGVLLAVSLCVGKVLATPQVGITTTILAKSVFDDIHVRARMFIADGDRDDDRRHRDSDDFWQTLIKTEGRSDVYVVDNKIAPGGTTGWHSHPGPSLIHVVAGTVTNYSSHDPSCAGHSYGVGDGFIDTGSDVHILRNEGSVPAETIAVQFLPKDAARKIDQPAPAHCSP